MSKGCFGMKDEFEYLISMKKSRKKPQEGDVLRKKYVDITTKQEIVLKHEPKYRSIFGLGSYGVVGKEVHKALC